MHRRRPFEIGSKNKLKHNMKTVLIAFRKKKDIAKQNALYENNVGLYWIIYQLSLSHINSVHPSLI